MGAWVAWAGSNRLLCAALAVLAGLPGCSDLELVYRQDFELRRAARGPAYTGPPWWVVGKDGVQHVTP